MATVLDKYERSTYPDGRLPTIDEVVTALLDPDNHSALAAYLHQRPEYASLVQDLVQLQPKWKSILDTIAYRKWEARGSPIGQPLADWFAAEAELRATVLTDS